MKPDSKSSKKQAASARQTGTSPTEAALKYYRIPATRENFLNLAYLGKPPEELGAEEEAMLPKRYQNRSREE